MDPEGYLPITLIATFHRVQALSADVALILSAVKESDKLEVYKDFKIRTKYDPLKWPMANVGPDGIPPTTPILRHEIHEISHPPATAIPAFVPVLIQAPPPVSEVLPNIPPPPIIRKKNASDSTTIIVNNNNINSGNKREAHVSANTDDSKVLPIAASSSTTITTSTSSSSSLTHQQQNNNDLKSPPAAAAAVVVSDNLNLNPDVSAFVPKSSPKNEVANAAMPPAAEAKYNSEAASTTNINNNNAINNHNLKSTEDANIWKEVKRRSKTTSQQKEVTAHHAGDGADHKAEKEELDFQFDEEIQFDDDIPHGGGRINNFSEFSDDEESDFELSDRDINKLLIVTQVKNRPPKHEGD